MLSLPVVGHSSTAISKWEPEIRLLEQRYNINIQMLKLLINCVCLYFLKLMNSTFSSQTLILIYALHIAKVNKSPISRKIWS